MRTARFWRRALATVAGLALAVGALSAPGIQQADAAGTLPLFRSTGAIVDPLDTTLPHNPTKEFIFPSVFHAGQYLANPLAEWYVYYAPHDAPGGINLMYSNSLDGPWTQYVNSPVIDNNHTGFNVSHVSSPDAFWNADEGKLFLYFHGENTVTRYSTSIDGVTFDYGGPIVSTNSVNAAQPGRTATETSYARVFAHPNPASGYKYGMFFMTNYSDNVRRINAAVSTNGRTWTVQPNILVEPGDVEGTNVSGADFMRWDGVNYIVYGSTVGTIFARSVNDSLTSTGAPRKLFVPKSAPPEAGRAASPQIVTSGGRTHLFYEYGERSHTTIGHAILDPTAVRDPLNTHPEDPDYSSCPAPGSDGFGGTSLDTANWNTIVRPELSQHTVSGGYLRTPTYVGNSTTAPLILKNTPSAPWEVTTKLTINPTNKYQQAGLILRKDDANSLRMGIAQSADGQRLEFIWRKAGVDRINTWTAEDYMMTPADFTGTIWLRMTHNGTYLTAAYSTDGLEFNNLGRSVTASQLGANKVGAYAYRGDASVPVRTAAYDFIRFTPNAQQLAACG
ncbi:DUF1349 domain-containing protein [Glaciihabitans arcticus]|uniref:DUF1349 domain-containing protein n=1 Tax=Glaciihabitans arcticus TaxID=2668039 RepID=A0A4Q9GSS7_9MICO|nr:DUF1349 domain-containing protein [Glaciihabitans arcticus]TBN57194.1 DUF1349 domain-containing protein [Glaciihabitans arcticus]